MTEQQNDGPKVVPFIWNAELILNRGPIDDPQCLNVVCSATMADHVGSYGEIILEENAVNWVADQIGEDPEDLIVVSLHWSMFDDAQLATPPAPEDAHGND